MSATSTREVTALPTDAALIAQACLGQRDAEVALFRRHVQRVQRLALSLVGNIPDAEDVTQETFVIAFEKLHTLREAQAFAAWLRTITIYRARRILRRRAVLRRLGLAQQVKAKLDEVMSPTASPMLRAELMALLASMQAWPADERIAFSLQHIEGLSLDEIVQATGASRATVNRRLQRARARLPESANG
jgi:RNA polymerase sigma-70 factor (ECF subfamily)